MILHHNYKVATVLSEIVATFLYFSMCVSKDNKSSYK